MGAARNPGLEGAVDYECTSGYRTILDAVSGQRVERARLSLACLQRLGPDVAPAMPEFVKMMKQTNAVVAIRALQIVDSAGKAGIPVLLDVLTNRQAYAQVYYLEGAIGFLIGLLWRLVLRGDSSKEKQKLGTTAKQAPG